MGRGFLRGLSEVSFGQDVMKRSLFFLILM